MTRVQTAGYDCPGGVEKREEREKLEKKQEIGEDVGVRLSLVPAHTGSGRGRKHHDVAES